MATYADMQNRIVSEIRRSDLATETQEAIQSAIAFYKRRPVVANQAVYGPVATVVDQRTYDLPADFVTMTNLTYVKDGISYDMVQVPVADLDALYPQLDDPATGPPLHFAIYADELHIGPQADSTEYELQGRYVSTLDAPTEDDDEGFWMTVAERAVRARAKAILIDDVLLEPELADRQYAIAKEEWGEIVREAELRAYARGVRPWGA